MNNYNFTQALDGLNNIDADNINSNNATFSNANITSLSNCNLINCNTSTTPLSGNNIVNKNYVDNNFIDFTTDQTISASNKRFNGLFCTGLSITPTLGGAGNRQQIYVSGTTLEFVPQFNNNLYKFNTRDGASTQTTPLTISSASVSITNNLITNNLTADNNTGTQNIYTTNTTGNINIATGQTTGNLNLGTTSSFTNINSSLLLRTKKKINEMQNITSDTTVVLGFPLPETNIIRTINQSLTSLTITLPTVSANERGMLFNFFKFQNNLNITFTSASPIFTLNALTTVVYTNSTLLSSDKRMTTLMCGFYSTLNYWIEVSNYSTFDRDYNNTIYPRLTIANTFSNTNIFNAQTTFNNNTPICSVAIPTANDHLVRKDYCDTNFAGLTSTNSFSGVNTFNGETNFNTWVNLKFRTRIYDLNSPFTNYTQMYMINGNEFVLAPNTNGDFISFYCKDATLGQLQTFKSSALGNTSFVPFIASSTATFNGQATFNNSTPISNTTPPTANNHLVRKDYCDTNFMFKTGNVADNINGIKTFTNKVNFNGSPCIVATGSSEFTGTNGYFQINPNMSSGTLNPASQNGTIGIVGLKDQTNDKVLLTLYSNTTHVSVKLSFTEGVSIGFGGSGQIANTSVICDGTNVIIKPNIKFSVDNTIQNSAFTGAGSLNGTYGLSNITIDTNGKITSLSSGLTSTNSFSGVNTFTNNVNCASSLTFTDITNFSTIQQNSAVLNIENPTLNSMIRLKTRASTGAVQNSLTLNTASCDILSPTLNLTGASPSSILAPNNLNGTINLFNNLTSGGTINIGSISGVNTINGNTTITNNLISNGQATFNNNTPICSVLTPTAVNHLVRKDYVDDNFVDKTSTQSISGDKTFDYYLKTKQGLWIYDAMFPYTNFMELSLLGTAMQFVPSFNSNSYQIYTNDALGTTNVPITINDASTTLDHQLICNNGAVFNTTLPTSSVNATSSNQFTIRGFTDATYATISSLTSYLTSATASLLYQEKIVGSIIQMAVNVVPSGYLACDGASLSTTTYSALFSVIGYTYGGSSSIFNAPDFRGMFLRGKGTNGIDSTYASSTNYGFIQSDGIKAHTHDILFGYLPTASGGGGQNAYNSTSPNYNNPGTGSGRATGLTSNNANPYPDTRPANYAVLFCIKY